MKCPICEVELMMTERQGVEIDYCSKCRGIWLDRGELDKIIEKSVGVAVPEPARPQATQPQFRANNEPVPFRRQDDHEEYKKHDDYDEHDRGGYGSHNGQKKKSILGELFDF